MARFTPAELDAFVQQARQGMTASWTIPVSRVQRGTIRDRGVRGPRWISKTELPAQIPGAVTAEAGDVEERVGEKQEEDDGVLELLLAAITHVGDGKEKYDVPTVEPLPVQWVGYRPGVGKKDPETQDMTEREKFDARSSTISLPNVTTNSP